MEASTRKLELAVLAGPAYAQTTFNEADADRDGLFEKQEFYGAMGDAALYGRWDSNNDALIEEDDEHIRLNYEFFVEIANRRPRPREARRTMGSAIAFGAPSARRPYRSAR